MTSETLLYFVTIRDRKGGETRYRIKKTAKMGKMSALYANRSFTTLADLQFLFNGEHIGENQMPRPSNLDMNSQIDCCPC